jgi:uroporphyrinogen III methyltransferase / synthase
MSSRRPLAGRTIVVTRSRAQAAAFSSVLRRDGARVIVAPAIALLPPRSWRRADRAIERLSSYQMVVFTSVNAVTRFIARLRRKGKEPRDLRRVEVVAIGPATAAALRKEGLRVAARPERFRAEGLVRTLRRRRVEGIRILLPRAAVARDLLVRALRRRGARVDVAPVYRTVAVRAGLRQVRMALRSGRLDLLTFASSSAVEAFAGRFGAADRRRLRRVPVAVLGPITARTARRRGFRVTVRPSAATISALAAAIARRFRDAVVD